MVTHKISVEARRPNFPSIFWFCLSWILGLGLGFGLGLGLGLANIERSCRSNFDLNFYYIFFSSLNCGDNLMGRPAEDKCSDDH